SRSSALSDFDAATPALLRLIFRLSMVLTSRASLRADDGFPSISSCNDELRCFEAGVAALNNCQVVYMPKQVYRSILHSKIYRTRSKQIPAGFRDLFCRTAIISRHMPTSLRLDT